MKSGSIPEVRAQAIQLFWQGKPLRQIARTLCIRPDDVEWLLFTRVAA